LPEDRASWEVLARGYKAFYKTETSPAEYETTWNRLLQRDDVFGIGAKTDGRLIGIAHYLFHTSAWATRICYLQDLFVAPEVRGKGTARALIEAVAWRPGKRRPRATIGSLRTATRSPACCTTRSQSTTGSSATTFHLQNNDL
jgi:GNAT superfamily N-acetyltransferase